MVQYCFVKDSSAITLHYIKLLCVNKLMIKLTACQYKVALVFVKRKLSELHRLADHSYVTSEINQGKYQLYI